MARAHNVIRIEGTLPQGEVWSVTPKFVGNFGPEITNYDDLLAWATNIGDAFADGAVPTALLTAMSAVTAINAIRAEYRDTTGNLVEVAERVLPTPVRGTATPNRPFQCAWVASLRTGRPGASYRGRLYWPYIAGGMDNATLRIPQSNLETLVTGMRDMLLSIQDATPEENTVYLAVVSKVRNVATPVNEISGGNVIDTQRRRRDTVAESYESTPFTAP